MGAKLNLQQIGIAYAGASLASVATGLVGTYFLGKLGYDPDVGLIVSGTWLATTGIPSLVVAGETLRRTLGQKQPAVVSASYGALGRKIPFSSQWRTGHVFASLLPGAAEPDIDLPQQFTVTLDRNDYTLTSSDLENFLYLAWRRQRAGLNGLSRQYWTREKRPRIKWLDYDVRMAVLLSVPGLVIDRSERRSGRLILPPKAAMAAIEQAY